jgi:hypothetical protein
MNKGLVRDAGTRIRTDFPHRTLSPVFYQLRLSQN